jgi:hypothetical protein
MTSEDDLDAEAEKIEAISKGYRERLRDLLVEELGSEQGNRREVIAMVAALCHALDALISAVGDGNNREMLAEMAREILAPPAA